jgi:hypothetical protein
MIVNNYLKVMLNEALAPELKARHKYLRRVIEKNQENNR